jgi:copper chaperone CopZ
MAMCDLWARAAVEENEGMSGGERTVIRVPGMDCATEVQMIRVALDQVPGIESVRIDLGRRTVAVTHEGSPERICAVLTALGLGAELAPGWQEGQESPDRRERPALIAVLAINATMFVVELVGGLLAHSSALLADSVDMLMDASVYLVALAAVGGTAAGRRRAARRSGWLQVSLAALVLLEVVRRAVMGSEPQSWVMFAFGGLALMANAASAILLAGKRDAGMHVRASWIFSVNDTVANLGVMVAGVLVAVTGKAWPDLAMGAAIAALVAAGGLRILRLSSRPPDPFG